MPRPLGLRESIQRPGSMGQKKDFANCLVRLIRISHPLVSHRRGIRLRVHPIRTRCQCSLGDFLRRLPFRSNRRHRCYLGLRIPTWGPTKRHRLNRHQQVLHLLYLYHRHPLRQLPTLEVHLTNRHRMGHRLGLLSRHRLQRLLKLEAHLRIRRLMSVRLPVNRWILGQCSRRVMPVLLEPRVRMTYLRYPTKPRHRPKQPRFSWNHNRSMRN